MNFFKNFNNIDALLKNAEEAISPEELQKGIEIEREHKGTIEWLKNYYKENNEFPSDDEIFKHIALEHFSEDKEYYIKLVKFIEKS